MSKFSESIQELSQDQLREILLTLHQSGDKALQRFLELRLSTQQGQSLAELEKWLDNIPKDTEPQTLDLEEALFLLNHTKANELTQSFNLSFLKHSLSWQIADNAKKSFAKLIQQFSELLTESSDKTSAEILSAVLFEDQENRLICLVKNFNAFCTPEDFLRLWQQEQSRIEIYKLRQDFAKLAHYSESFCLMALSFANFELAEQACQISNQELTEYQRLTLAQKAFDLKDFDRALAYLKASFPKELIAKLEQQEQVYRAQNDLEQIKENLLSQFQVQPDLKRFNKIIDSQTIDATKFEEIALERTLRDQTLHRSLIILDQLNQSENIIDKTIKYHDDFELIYIDELHSLQEHFQTKEKLVSLTCLRAILVKSLKSEKYSAQKDAEEYWQELAELTESFDQLPQGYLSHHMFRQELHYRFPEHRHFLI